MTVERAVRARLRAVNGVLAAHAGRLELVEIRGGVIHVRFLEACAGCQLRPVTMATVVRPALETLPQVSRVEAPGTRLAAAAEDRLRQALARRT
jgi:Fe-S cluster biogenesis protein NfuA